MELTRSSRKPKLLTAQHNPQPDSGRAGVDFDLPVRAFIKKYAHAMSGPKRLTLMVAWMAKGQPNVQVARAEASKTWNKMKGLMGGAFNSAYETRARDNGWLNSPKTGVYTLLPSWQEVL
jgi:hypothetical protein